MRQERPLSKELLPEAEMAPQLGIIIIIIFTIKGQKVTLKGLLFKDDKARNLFRSNQKADKAKGRPRVHLVDQDNNSDKASPADRLGNDAVNADLEFLLSQNENDDK